MFFQKFFQKHPPRIVSHFKQVKGLLIFFSKYPHFFDLRFKQVKGQIFSKKFLKNRSIWVCILIPFVQMSERSFFYGKIIKENLTGMGLFFSPKTGRRTYNDLCRKCRNNCKQSFRAIVVCCPMYCSKRSVKSVPTATISTIRDKRITDIHFKIKRLTEKNFDNFGTFSIQKNGCRVIILTRRSKQFNGR